MEEFIPVAAGVVVGLLAHRVGSTRVRAMVFVILSMAAGIFSSWITGELAVSWHFVAIDIGQVLGVGVLTLVLLATVQRIRGRALGSRV